MPFDIPDNDVAFHTNQSIWMSTDIDILAVGLNGVGVLSGCEVTAQGSPDMTVAIAAGTIRIASGLYVAVTSGNGTITSADATNPRIDLISASDAGTKTVTAGTAAANPKAPALPSGHVGLAMVYVPANDTTIATNQITDKRVILAGYGNLWKMSKNSSSQTLTNNTDTLITWEEGSTIDGGGSVIDLANDRFVIPATGFYTLHVTWLWETTAPTSAASAITCKVGSTEIGPRSRHQLSGATADGGSNADFALTCTSGDFVTVLINPGAVTGCTARGNASQHLRTSVWLQRVT